MHCLKCGRTGVCQPCKGTGRSGNSGLRPVGTLTRTCPWCKGSKKCDECRGTGEIREPEFRPYIRVLHSGRVPSPIFVAVLTGTPWRFLRIPTDILSRSASAQLGYVGWRCRTHYREAKGECFLLGRITGYEWIKSRSEVILLDVHGRRTRRAGKPSSLGIGRLNIGCKTVTCRTRNMTHVLVTR